MKKGWRNESARHSLAARGHKTVRNDVVRRTQNAYSLGISYSNREWGRIAEWLLELGYGPNATEEILRSKYMRWADDYAGQGVGAGRMTLEKFKPIFKKWQHDIDKMLVNELRFGSDEMPSTSDVPLPSGGSPARAAAEEEVGDLLEKIRRHRDAGDITNEEYDEITTHLYEVERRLRRL